jgi:bacteriocin-like protein
MKNYIEISGYNVFTELSVKELSGIYGGNFFYCDPSNCPVAYAADILISFVMDNIEHPIGAAAGYHPK